jgi:F420-dependent oxidoreductase-like protein
MTESIRLGANCWNQYTTWLDLLAAGRRADELGYHTLWTWDHLYPIVGSSDGPMFEAWLMLAAWAQATEHVRIGLMVGANTFRVPTLTAKMATTLDHISGGRAILGIGAAWNDSESAGYGIDFPPIGERMDRLDEAVTIAKLMFTEERPSFQGKHYRIEQALNRPRPIQPGGPKILIGGGGEKRTLRILARHGDIGHWFGGPLDDLKRKKGVFEQHCEAEGRDPSSVLLTIGMNIVLVANEKDAAAAVERVPEQRRSMVSAATPDKAAEMLRPFLDAGFGGFTLSNMTQPNAESIALAGELIKLVRGSQVAA